MTNTASANTNPNPIATIATELGLRPEGVAGAVALLDEGNTIPFIARYRKENTGTLDEEELRAVAERLAYLRSLAERKAAVLASIEEQGALTPELRSAIQEATSLQVVEDLYLPHRPRRRTRATAARERGLQPLADLLLTQPRQGRPAQAAAAYLNEEVPDVDAALAGARDIVAETMAETPALRSRARRRYYEDASLTVAVRADPDRKYEIYHDFQVAVDRIQPHQVLAINRGEAEKALRVRFTDPRDDLLTAALRTLGANRQSPFFEQMQQAVEDGYDRLLSAAVEREVRAALTEAAEDSAIGAFQQNLRSLLLQPPLRGRTVLGIDPAYRTGCKLAVCDPTGRVLASGAIYPHPPQKRRDEALNVLVDLIRRHGVGAVAVGNGTASRETEALVAEALARVAKQTPDEAPAYAIVNEAGASVYSASPLARAELPDLDVTIRGAVSIARRLQDPLAELVKIDPKSIGVGLYQHDVNQKKLGGALETVIESVVNQVGVNVNTASPALLQQVAGLTGRTAENIVVHRDQHGPFRNRKQILTVAGIGPKSFEQAAGFLRIPDGDDPLDNTGIHPESYGIVERLVADFETLSQVPVERLRSRVGQLADELGVGQPTLADILDALAQPGRDPRDELDAPILRSDVLGMDDLHEGMWLKGTVRNVVAFGAFVDIGVKQDGLVHISQMADRYIQDPHGVVSVGDVIDVRVLSVDQDRGRIGLSMKADAGAAPEQKQKPGKGVSWREN